MVELGPCHALVVDGCAVGHRSLAPYLSLLVWVSAPATLRAKRLAQRFDWEMYEPHAAMWAAQESSLRSGDDVTTSRPDESTTAYPSLLALPASTREGIRLLGKRTRSGESSHAHLIDAATPRRIGRAIR